MRQENKSGHVKVLVVARHTRPGGGGCVGFNLLPFWNAVGVTSALIYSLHLSVIVGSSSSSSSFITSFIPPISPVFTLPHPPACLSVSLYSRSSSCQLMVQCSEGLGLRALSLWFPSTHNRKEGTHPVYTAHTHTHTHTHRHTCILYFIYMYWRPTYRLWGCAVDAQPGGDSPVTLSSLYLTNISCVCVCVCVCVCQASVGWKPQTPKS